MDRKLDDPLERRIRRFVRIEMAEVKLKNDSILRLHYIKDSRNSNSLRLFWLLMLVLSFSLLVYQIYDRVDYFLSEPLTVITKIEDNVNTDIFPKFLLCSQITSRSMKHYPDCRGMSSIQWENKNTSEIWELYDNIDDIELIYKREMMKSKIIQETVPFFSATCNAFKLGVQGNGFLEHFEIRIKYFPNCLQVPYTHTTIYFPDDGIGILQSHMNLDGGMKWNILFSKLSQLQYINRRNEPCVDEETHEKCLHRCEIKIYDSNDASCRYPFELLSKPIPLCIENGNTRGKLRNTLKILNMTSDMCNCTRKCNEILIGGEKYFIKQLYNRTEITFTLPQIEHSFILTDNGKCNRYHYPDDVFRAGVSRLQGGKRTRNTSCPEMTDKMYLSSGEDENDILDERPLFVQNIVSTFMKKYKFLNTNAYPCTDKISHIRCRENCRRTAIEKLKCRLPYMMNITEIKLCSTTEAAYNSRLQYSKSVDECICAKKCIQTLYDVIVDIKEINNTYRKTILTKQSSNKVVIIEQNFSYPFIKLLADIGNVLGITAGISIMSLITFIIG